MSVCAIAVVAVVGHVGICVASVFAVFASVRKLITATSRELLSQVGRDNLLDLRIASYFLK
jgi:hypothetical protein